MKSVNRKIRSFGKVFAFVAIASFSLISCDNKEDIRYWEDDPIVRVDKAKAEMKKRLVEDSPNGWIISFSPDGGKYIGEFNAWFEFKEDWSVNIKTDLNRGDLGAQTSEYNFTMLRTFALSFPNGNRIHDFTQFDASNLKTDIEFMYNDYLPNGDIETIGYMSGQKVVFRKATAEDKAFVFTKKWQAYDRLEAAKTMEITYGGRTYRMDYTPYIHDIEVDPEFNGLFYRMSVLRTHNVLGSVTPTGSVTFASDNEGEIITLKPVLEMPDGSVIEEVMWTGSAFVGTSDTGTGSVIIK